MEPKQFFHSHWAAWHALAQLCVRVMAARESLKFLAESQVAWRLDQDVEVKKYAEIKYTQSFKVCSVQCNVQCTVYQLPV